MNTIDYTMRFFCAANRPRIAHELMQHYTSTLAGMGIDRVVSMSLRCDSPDLYFVCAETVSGKRVGALAAYRCSQDLRGPVEAEFCALGASVADELRHRAQEGLANLCLGWVDPQHRRAGLYARIIRTLLAALPAVGIHHMTAMGATKGMTYYRKFGLLVDPSVGDNGAFHYPKGYVSQLGWGSVLNLTEAAETERNTIGRLRSAMSSTPVRDFSMSKTRYRFASTFRR